MWREFFPHRLQQIVVVPQRRERAKRSKGSTGRHKFLHLGHSGVGSDLLWAPERGQTAENRKPAFERWRKADRRAGKATFQAAAAA